MIVQLAGHLGYPGDCIPVFHPEFPAFCDTYAQALDATRDDPYLIGHFSDNELPTPVDLLDRSLALDLSNANTNPGCQAARSWLARRKGAAAADITDDDREAFREFVYDRYFALTTAAIRKHDPNHLLLGSRFYGPTLTSPGVFAAAARHVDALSMNVYWQWTPEPNQLAMWSREAAKPFLVTEFYAKGDDAGMGNTSGAGWIVPTQSDRALFYQHFTLALLQSRQCIGWNWFKYIDNDPDDPTTDPSNRDSNKGIVNIHYAPYHDLLAGMRTLNRNLYALADYFDRPL